MHQISWKLIPRLLKTQKNDTEINRIPTSSTSWFLHTLSHQMLVFQAPDDQIHHRKTQKKEPGNKHEKRHLFWSKVQEKLSKWGPKMHPKSIKIKALTPGCPFVYPQVSLDRPRGPQGAKMEAPGLPNDRFGNQKWACSSPKGQLWL